MRPSHFLAGLAASSLLTSCPSSTTGSGPDTGPGRGLAVGPEIKAVKVLDQHWSDAQARAYYNKTQGSQMMPYDWFLHLEQENSTTLFRDAAHMRSLGYLTRVPDKNGNPDGLPIGFAKNDKALGLTCSACHTGQVTFQGTVYLIDGAPTSADAQTMMNQLVAAMKATHSDDAKFGRFATAVLGSSSSDAAKADLKRQLKEVIERRDQYNKRNFPSESKLAFGPGRIDAFDAIFNEVAVRFAQVPNAKTQCDAPVSYPFLWDTPQHDRVQWNGSAENLVLAGIHIGALGRNVGEVLGVFADVETTKVEEPLRGYPSSVNTTTLTELEDLLRDLWSPKWPEAFGKINPDLVKSGRGLFEKHCIECHKDIDRTDPNRKVIAQMRAVGTDESMARNAATRTSPSGIFQGRLLLPLHPLKAVEPVSNLLSHLGQRVLIGSHPITDPNQDPFLFDVLAEIGVGEDRTTLVLNNAEFEGGKLKSGKLKAHSSSVRGTLLKLKSASDLKDLPPRLKEQVHPTADATTPGESDVILQAQDSQSAKLPYKGRPLNGIWATAPYLHNGSVLNLDELLKPAKDRMKTFKLGSHEFDPKNVGFVNEGDYVFDTEAQPGNSNAGHDDYGKDASGNPKVFTDAERAQLIEYMKSL